MLPKPASIGEGYPAVPRINKGEVHVRPVRNHLQTPINFERCVEVKRRFIKTQISHMYYLDEMQIHIGSDANSIRIIASNAGSLLSLLQMAGPGIPTRDLPRCAASCKCRRASQPPRPSGRTFCFFSSGLPRGVTADPRAAPPLFSRPAAQLAAKRAVVLAAQPAAQKDEIQDADVSRF